MLVTKQRLSISVNRLTLSLTMSLPTLLVFRATHTDAEYSNEFLSIVSSLRRSRTLDEIRKCHRQLLDDQYGNYVIQHVLQYGRHSDRDSLLEIVTEGGILSLSKQKFASNVVEKLLKFGNAGQRNAIVRELLKVSCL